MKRVFSSISDMFRNRKMIQNSDAWLFGFSAGDDARKCEGSANGVLTSAS